MMPASVVLIHGMWCGPWAWDRYAGFLEQRGWRCLRPALRYHDVEPAAAPDPRLGQVSLLDYAADLETLVRALNEPPVLVGHSMGGLLALMLAARGLARAAVLLTPAWPRGINGLTPAVIRSFLGVILRPRFWRNPVRLGLRGATYAMLGSLPPEERRGIYERLVHESGRAIAEIGLWFLDPRRASRVDASAVSCPVLLVAAAEDRLTPASAVRRTAALLGTGATLRELPGFQHWVVGAPGWEKVAGLVADWLVERGARRHGAASPP
jgi:pimeloyl-ACP methyl ester carboxylesterase